MHSFLKRRQPGAADPPGSQGGAKARNHLHYFFGFLSFGAAWQLLRLAKASPALPPPWAIARALFYLIRDGPLLRHAAASVGILLAGMGIAVAAGAAVGLMLFRYRAFRAAAYPVIECARGIASLTLFPLLIVLFGLGASARAFVIFWTAWPAVVLSTYGSLDVDREVIDAARVSGAGEWQAIFSIRIPMAAQGIMTGIRIAMGGAWIALIPAEMLGASKGLGYFLLWSTQSFEFEKAYATILSIAAVGGMMNLLLILLQKKLYLLAGG